MNEFLNFVKEAKVPLIIGALFSTLSSALLIVPFVLIFEVIKMCFFSGPNMDVHLLFSLFGMAAGAVVLRYFFALSGVVFFHKGAFNLVYATRVKLTTHVGKLPMGFWSNKDTGDVLKLVQDDVEAVEEYIGHQLPDGINAFVLPLVTIGYLYSINWKISIFATVPFVLILVLLYLTTRGFLTGQDRKSMTKKYHSSISKMNSGMFEFVRGMAVIKMFGITADSFKRLQQSIQEYKDTVTLWQKGVAPYRSLITSVALSGGLFILPASLYYLHKGKTDTLQVLFIMLLGCGCFASLPRVMMVLTRMELVNVVIRRIRGLLDNTVLYEPGTPLVPGSYDISLKDVTFAYDMNGKEAVSHITMNLPQDSFSAFVGPSGAGKTTLVHLIARMWDVTNGTITIGNKTLQEIGSKGIAQLVGTMFQDVHILTDTVAHNIDLENRATPEEIKQAAQKAACHDFITALPGGYDTVIGDGGETHLSGGERQRIALARLILRDPPIVLLDEATSYADAENESKIQAAFSEFLVNKTVVVIAHRLSTIVKADRIYVIDEGRLVEEGPHEELIQQNGIYTSMWQARVKARNWELS